MHIFRTSLFRALALALALPVAALVIAGCDVGSTDSTTAVMADNEGNIYNYSGLYMSITNTSGSTNGYGTLVFPAGRQSGAALIWLRLLQYGSVVEAYDSAGMTWSGNVSAQNGETASFSLQGRTTAGNSVEIFGTLDYAEQLSTMDATWIEPGFAGNIFAQATVSPVATNSPVVTNTPTGDVSVSPTSKELTTNGQSQVFTASGGDGTYTWSYTSGNGSLSSTTGTSITFTRNSSGSGILYAISDDRSATAIITCP